jgi:hypothetical protein
MNSPASALLTRSSTFCHVCGTMPSSKSRAKLELLLIWVRPGLLCFVEGGLVVRSPHWVENVAEMAGQGWWLGDLAPSFISILRFSFDSWVLAPLSLTSCLQTRRMCGLLFLLHGMPKDAISCAKLLSKLDSFRTPRPPRAQTRTGGTDSGSSRTFN